MIAWYKAFLVQTRWYFSRVLSRLGMALDPSGGRRQRHAKRLAEGGGEGRRRRKRTTHDDEGSIVFDSMQAFGVVKAWAWGEISGPRLQATMSDAYEDQLAILDRVGMSRDFVASSVSSLAALGSHGRYPNNIRRDLLRRLGIVKLPEPLYSDVRMRVPKAGVDDGFEQPVSFPILLPHEWFSQIYHDYPQRFQDMCMGGASTPDVLKGFWKGVVKRRDHDLRFARCAGIKGGSPTRHH